MSTLPLQRIIQHLRRVTSPDEAGAVSDADLLERFLRRRDEAAFELLVRRHERLVWGVCGRVLRQPQDAEDAFQATFLAFLRHAHSIKTRASLAGWLYRVAHRIALRASDGLARRGRCEAPGVDLGAVSAADDPVSEAAWRDIAPVIDEEVNHLAEKYRLPVVLCYLQGKTYAEAARELGCPKGTVSIRLTRARALLRARLTGRGLAGAGIVLAAAVPVKAVPASLVATTLMAVFRVASGKVALAGATSARVAALAEGVSASLSPAKIALSLAFALGLILSGTGLLAHQTAPQEPIAETPKPHGRSARPAKPPAEARLDRFGDPLPPGAIQRLGTVRLRHAGLNGLAFSRDGKTLLSAGGDQVIRVWDVATGSQARSLPGPAGFSIFYRSTFSPDGKLLAGPDWRSLRLWDVTRGKERASVAFAAGSGGSAVAPAFSPDGRMLTTADDHGVVQLWDLNPLKERCRWQYQRTIYGVAFSPDGKAVAAISDRPHGSLRLWDVDTGADLLGIAIKEDLGFAFSPDGKILVSAGRGPTARLWDARSGEERGTFALPAHDDNLAVAPRLAFSPDGKALATGGDGRPVVLWDLAARKELRQLRVGSNGSVGQAAQLAFAPDGKTLASGASNTIRLWDVRTGQELHSRDGHTGEVNAVAVSPDGKLVASASWQDYTVRLWDRATGRSLHRLTGHTAYIRAVAFSPDGRTLVSGGGDGTLRLWDTASGKELRTFRLNGGPGGRREQIMSLRVSTDGKTLAAVSSPTGAGGPAYWAWGLARGGEPVEKALAAAAAGAFPYLLAPDVRTVAMIRGGEVVLEDPTTGKDREFRGAKHFQGPLAFSPDGKMLGVWTGDARTEKGGVALWDVAEGKPRLTLDTDAAGFVAFSGDCRYVATACPDDLRLWAVATGREVLRRPRPAAFHGQHGNAFASSLAFTPDGRSLVTGLPDTTVLVWDLAPEKGAAAPALKREDIARLWNDLADGDGPKGFRATWLLAHRPHPAVVAFLKERLAPVSLDRGRVRKLLRDLDSDEFAVRERARQALDAFGEEIEPLLREARAAKPSADVRKSLDELLSKDQNVLGPGETLRAVRAVEVLEHIGTPEARGVLEKLSRGEPEARLTREAKAALERLAARPAAVP